jgi:hypothetical protein
MSKPRIIPKNHFMRDRKKEMVIGFVLFLVGCLLLYDAFDARGKRMPMPAGIVTPW